jgi:zinc protease
MKALVLSALASFLLMHPSPTLAQSPAGAAAPAAGAPAEADTQAEADALIPFHRFVLSNGLRLIVHEDRKAPIVAVNVWYHVGSKDERPGRTGFAHLFEHLMFNGSENFDDDFFVPLERVGATDLNGTTNTDRTNYFQNVPTPALDMVLWLEADRMGHLLGAVTQEKLDEQRGVVQNEKRQGEDQPYGRVFTYIQENTFPEGHPYRWPVIGYMEDLEAATLDDVHEWFEEFYGAANAVIVVAGDIDPETARQKVEHHFGHIPPGPPLTRQRAWIPRLEGEHRARMEDRVPQARVYRVWNVPQWGTEEAHHLEMVTNLLTQGRASRLQRRLVQEEQVATDVVGFTPLREIAGQVILWATARPGEGLDEVERLMNEELARFLEEGPTERELQRVKTQMRASFLRGIERIGGFGGKSDILAENEVYGGNPGRYRDRLARIESATAEDLLRVAREWLGDGSFVLEVHPYPEHRVAEAVADRSTLPMPETQPDVSFPDFRRTTLSNGLEVVLAQRDAVPLVNLSLVVDAGYASDSHARPGTASLTASMLTHGTRSRSSLEIAEEIAMLGMTLGSGANVDASSVSASILKENLDPSLELFADVALNPTFPEADFQREQRQRLAQIQREKVTPVQMGLRVLPALLYGEDHAYGTPLTGSGTEESVMALNRAELARFHETWYRPNNATLVVVGDVSLEELTPRLERLFSGWAPAEVPEKNLAAVGLPQAPVVYLMDRPGSTQSVIFAGHPVIPKAHPDDLALGSLDNILGAAFTSRINMNLREDKGWSYGAFTILWDAVGQRPFFAFAPVQADRTVESMAELLREMEAVRDGAPPSQEELEKARDLQVLTLPGQWETNGAVLGSLAEMIRYGLPEDHFDTLDERLRELTTAELARAAREHLHPDRMVWVVVGDRSQFEEALLELGLGEIRFIDADGRVVDRE